MVEIWCTGARSRKALSFTCRTVRLRHNTVPANLVYAKATSPTAQKTAQPCHASVRRSIMRRPQPSKGFFMHPHWTIWEFLDHARTSPESHPNLLRLHETPLTHRLLLACIYQSKTTATGHMFPGHIDHRAPYLTKGTHKPRSATTEVTWGPGNRHPSDHRTTL
jgi:hypothetical protein